MHKIQTEITAGFQTGSLITGGGREIGILDDVILPACLWVPDLTWGKQQLKE